MEKRTSAATRIFAALALIGAVLAVVVVVSLAMDSDTSSRNEKKGQQTQKENKPKRSQPATYTIEAGDTLTSIAQETGVSVNQIIELNPDVDPQILTAGETLKLR
jgi:LysM repeat protein